MIKITSDENEENDIHKISLADLQKRFQVDISTGLSSSRAQELLKKRRLEEIKQQYIRFLKIFKMPLLSLIDVFSIVTWISLTCLLIYYELLGGDTTNLICAGLIVSCILVTTFSVVVNEYRMFRLASTNVDDSQNNLALVLRDSNWVKIPTNELLVGDVVEIAANQHVPADLRLVSVNGLSFDRSIITGDTEDVEASLNNFENTSYYDAKNMAFKNFWTVSGNGRGVVVSSTGDFQKSQLESNKPLVNNGSRRAILQIGFGTILITFALIVIYLIVWASYLRIAYNYPTKTLISNIFNIIVTGVPYSCPTSIMIGYLLYIRNFKKLHIAVKKRFFLASINSIDVVLTDKSGTITKNEFAVTNAFFCQRDIDLTRSLRSSSHVFDRFISMLEMAYREDSKNPIEQATNRFFKKFRLLEPNKRQKYEIVEKIEFSSANMYHAILFKPRINNKVQDINLELGDKESSTCLELIIIGITEFLLPKCKELLSKDGVNNVELDADGLNHIQAKIDKWALSGRKLVCFCRKEIDEEAFNRAREKPNYNFQRWFNSECTNLTFVGMTGFMDPPQPGIKDTVNQILDLGLKVIMVTGDYSLTSASMAIQAGIFSSKKYDTLAKFRQNRANNRTTEFSYTRGILLNGAEIESLSKEEFGLIYSEYFQMVVSRATPNHKLQLVKLLQANKHSVLMVGDGLNDVSALKQADHSVAMNSGSKLAIEESNMALLNNSFGSIYDILLMGRKYFLTIQPAFLFVLSSIFTQYVATFMSSVLGIPQLYSNPQMILFSTFIELIPTMSLLSEKSDINSVKSAGKMKVYTFRLVMFSFLLGLMTTIFAYFVFFLYLIKYAGIPASELIFRSFRDPNANNSDPNVIAAQTIAFYDIVIVHMFGNLYSIRSMHKSIFETVPFFGTYSNLFLVFSSILVAAFMIIIVTFPIPGLTVNMLPVFYVIPFIDSVILLILIEGLRFIFLRKRIYPYNA